MIYVISEVLFFGTNKEYILFIIYKWKAEFMQFVYFSNTTLLV